MIGSNETAIVGSWIMVDGHIQGDAACERIKRLTENCLEKLGTDSTGWQTLFRDPEDGRLWELTYPQGDLHGGGPPAIRYMDSDQAREKFPDVFGEAQ
jgi:hypothetical protein